MNTMTGARIRRVLRFQCEQGKQVTVTAVRPPSRFGELLVDDALVRSFFVEIASNDGYLLLHYVQAGIAILGVPTALLARRSRAICKKTRLGCAATMRIATAWRVNRKPIDARLINERVKRVRVRAGQRRVLV